ncbi:MAG: sulfate permease [Candidatus Nanopelagicales bacterium]|uniref:sulfate permease n=1 Tax=Rhodococcus pyridinivorans TaxID=103816 RepID=UPI00265AFB7E|nr:sulfate permease [Rhodococcus pyridinivorans]MCO5299299.1 sulfate permease [Candidatus Nanopelagicales bacterium]HPE12354.1 sulfate permease [Actinomycetota bacterium]HRV64768.1 sulfate permease [Candidatus Nanopelagicales bacterium]
MFRLILTTTAYVHGLLAYAPSNLLLDRIRTREGLKWGKRAMLLAIPYFAIAYWCTTIIDNGGPGWLNLVVLICIWNAFKFLIMGPVSMVMLVKIRIQEKRQERSEGETELVGTDRP